MWVERVIGIDTFDSVILATFQDFESNFHGMVSDISCFNNKKKCPISMSPNVCWQWLIIVKKKLFLLYVLAKWNSISQHKLPHMHFWNLVHAFSSLQVTYKYTSNKTLDSSETTQCFYFHNCVCFRSMRNWTVCAHRLLSYIRSVRDVQHSFHSSWVERQYSKQKSILI